MKKNLAFILGERNNEVLIDPNTIHLLQGLCPALSLEDRAFVQKHMHDILPAIRDESDRSEVFDRLCSMKQIITSLHTFLEDTKYLEPCARILKKLLPSKCKGSLSQHFSALHHGEANIKVQTSEFSFQNRAVSSGPYASWLSYRQLWLCALRHFPVMDGQAPRRDVGKQNSWKSGLQLGWWVDLSLLAVESGYKCIRQSYPDRKAADVSMIEDCLRRLRPPKYFKIDQELMHRKARLIYEIIGEIARKENAAPTPALTSSHDNCRPDISDRCGRPRIKALEADEDYLFVDHIYSTSLDMMPRQYLTSFAVTRDFFHRFFGTAEDDLDENSSLHVSTNRNPSLVYNTNSSLGPSYPGLTGLNDQAGPSDPPNQQSLPDFQKGQTILDPQNPSNALVLSESQTNQQNSQAQLTHQEPDVVPSAAATEVMDFAIGIQSLAQFGQEIREMLIPKQTALRLLFRDRINTKPRVFNVLSPAKNGMYSIRRADISNRSSIVDALQLPSDCNFLVRDGGKRLKLSAPTTIVAEAHAQKNDTTIAVSRRSVQQITQQFEGFTEYSSASKQSNLANLKPVHISVWKNGNFTLETSVTRQETKEAVVSLKLSHPGFESYDWEGNMVSSKDCFDAAQNDVPPTIYLCPPEEASKVFPMEM